MRKCQCSTRYYPKGSIFGDGYVVEGVCLKTWKGYTCRNETWDKTGDYRLPGACYHKDTLVRVIDE